MSLIRSRFRLVHLLHGPFSLRCGTLKCSSSSAVAETETDQQNIQFYLKTTKIPPELDGAVKNYLKKFPKETVVNDGLKLAKYLRNRGRPVPLKHTSKQNINQKEPGESIQKDEPEELFVDDDLQETKDLTDVKSNRRATRAEQRKQLLHQFNVIRYGDRETKAFAASRIPSCYGSALRVFNEIRIRQPEFNPKTVLDFGSGAGTAYWAAKASWLQPIQEYQFVDPSDSMLKLSEELIRKANNLSDPLLYGVFFRKFLPMTKITYDLVVSAYTLSELPFASQRKQLIKQLWDKTKHFLVIIEPGNNEGFEINLQARNLLVKKPSANYDEDAESCSVDDEPASIFSPCPHEEVCARSERESRDHPCNFEQRVGLSYAQEFTPLKRFGYSTERFSYIVLKKGSVKDLNHPRLLHPVKKRKGHIVCDLCCRNGNIQQHVLSKTKHKELYKRARHKLNWGDMLPIDTTIGNPVKVVQPPEPKEIV